MEKKQNFSGNFSVKTNYGTLAAAAIPLVVIAGAYAAFTFLNRWRGNKKNRVLKRSVSLSVLHGGKQALERLLDYQKARSDFSDTLGTAECHLKTLLEDSPHLDFKLLQRNVAKMEMSGNEDKAIEILEKALKRAKKDEKTLDDYEIEMLIVEALIYKGEFDKAQNRKCLDDRRISADARRALYKAIILMAKGEKLQARKNWEEFVEIRRHFDDFPPSVKESMEEILESNGLDKIMTKFDEFEKFVNRFQQDIDKAKRKKTKN
ncbi:hypothetical protein UlMin_018933 [Ulmus minor]